MEKLSAYQLAQVEKIWLDNPMLHKLLKEEERYKLAWSFISLNDVSTAETLFSQLIEVQYDKDALARFAIKLSISYAAKNNRKKKVEFETIAESFS